MSFALFATFLGVKADMIAFTTKPGENCYWGAGYDIRTGECMPNPLANNLIPDCGTSDGPDAFCLERIPEAGETGYDSFIKERTSFDMAVDTAFRAEGSKSGATVGVGATYVGKHSSGSLGITALIGSTITLERRRIRSMTHMKLSATAEQWLKDSPRKFVEVYGTHFVSDIIFGGTFIGSLQITQNSATAASQVSGEADLKYQDCFQAKGEANAFVSDSKGHYSSFVTYTYRGGPLVTGSETIKAAPKSNRRLEMESRRRSERSEKLKAALYEIREERKERAARGEDVEEVDEEEEEVFHEEVWWQDDRNNEDGSGTSTAEGESTSAATNTTAPAANTTAAAATNAATPSPTMKDINLKSKLDEQKKRMEDLARAAEMKGPSEQLDADTLKKRWQAWTAGIDLLNAVPITMATTSWLQVEQIRDLLEGEEGNIAVLKAESPPKRIVDMLSREYVLTLSQVTMAEKLASYKCVKDNAKLMQQVGQLQMQMNAQLLRIETLTAPGTTELAYKVMKMEFQFFEATQGKYQHKIDGVLEKCRLRWLHVEGGQYYINLLDENWSTAHFRGKKETKTTYYKLRIHLDKKSVPTDSLDTRKTVNVVGTDDFFTDIDDYPRSAKATGGYYAVPWGRSTDDRTTKDCNGMLTFKNAGKNCWDGCKTGGECKKGYCGNQGVCCRKWYADGPRCPDGIQGEQHWKHVCVRSATNYWPKCDYKALQSRFAVNLRGTPFAINEIVKHPGLNRKEPGLSKWGRSSRDFPPEFRSHGTTGCDRGERQCQGSYGGASTEEGTGGIGWELQIVDRNEFVREVLIARCEDTAVACFNANTECKCLNCAAGYFNLEGSCFECESAVANHCEQVSSDDCRVCLKCKDSWRLINGLCLSNESVMDWYTPPTSHQMAAKHQWLEKDSNGNFWIILTGLNFATEDAQTTTHKRLLLAEPPKVGDTKVSVSMEGQHPTERTAVLESGREGRTAQRCFEYDVDYAGSEIKRYTYLTGPSNTMGSQSQTKEGFMQSLPNVFGGFGSWGKPETKQVGYVKQKTADQIEENRDLKEIENPFGCQNRCREFKGCTHFTWTSYIEHDNPAYTCSLKNSARGSVKALVGSAKTYVSGPQNCGDCPRPEQIRYTENAMDGKFKCGIKDEKCDCGCGDYENGLDTIDCTKPRNMSPENRVFWGQARSCSDRIESKMRIDLSGTPFEVQTIFETRVANPNGEYGDCNEGSSRKKACGMICGGQHGRCGVCGVEIDNLDATVTLFVDDQAHFDMEANRLNPTVITSLAYDWIDGDYCVSSTQIIDTSSMKPMEFTSFEEAKKKCSDLQHCLGVMDKGCSQKPDSEEIAEEEESAVEEEEEEWRRRGVDGTGTFRLCQTQLFHGSSKGTCVHKKTDRIDNREDDW